MTPLHPTFRNLLLKNAPKLEREEIDRYESLLALRLELIHARSLAASTPGSHPGKPSRDQIDKLIKATTEKAKNIVDDRARGLQALQSRWVARRQIGLQQGNLLPIPTSLNNVSGLSGATTRYWLVQLATAGILTNEFLLRGIEGKNMGKARTWIVEKQKGFSSFIGRRIDWLQRKNFSLRRKKKSD